MIHCVKCESSYFESLDNESKTFEVRFNDRDYRVGDYLAVNEVKAQPVPTYTGRACFFEITYVLSHYEEALKPGYVVLGLKKMYLRETNNVARNTKCDEYNTIWKENDDELHEQESNPCKS